MQTRYLWIQDRVAAGDIVVKKVDTSKNVSDLLTKQLTLAELWKHMTTLGFKVVGKHKLQKRANLS